MDFYPCRTSPGQDNGGRESEINRGSTRDGDGMLAPKTLETSQEPMETSWLWSYICRSHGLWLDRYDISRRRWSWHMCRWWWIYECYDLHTKKTFHEHKSMRYCLTRWWADLVTCLPLRFVQCWFSCWPTANNSSYWLFLLHCQHLRCLSSKASPSCALALTTHISPTPSVFNSIPKLLSSQMSEPIAFLKLTPAHPTIYFPPIIFWIVCLLSSWWSFPYLFKWQLPNSFWLITRPFFPMSKASITSSIFSAIFLDLWGSQYAEVLVPLVEGFGYERMFGNGKL